MSVVGSIAVNVVARTRAFIEGMQKSRKELKSFENAYKATQNVVSTAVSLAGTIAGASYVAAIRETATQLGDVASAADRLGVSTQSLISLKYGAGFAGIEVDSLTKSMGGLAAKVSDAAKGTGEAATVIDELKLNAAELAKLSPDKMMERIADALGKVSSQGDKLRISTKLFGGEGGKFLNFLSNGAEGLERYRKEAEKLGIAFSREQITQVEKMNDAMTRLGTAWDGVKGEITINIAPAATDALNTLKQYISLNPLKGEKKTSQFEKKQMDAIADRNDNILLRPDLQVMKWYRGIEESLIKRQLELEKPTAPANIPGLAGTARFGLRNPFTPERADALVGRGDAREEAKKRALVAFKAWIGRGNDKSFLGKMLGGVSDAAEWALRPDAPGGLGQQLGQFGIFGRLRGMKNQARDFGLQFQRDFMLQKLLGGGGAVGLGKSSLPMGGNEIVERGTQAAYQASKASDHVAKLLREQLQIGKQQVEHLAKLVQNTGGNDTFSMGAA